MGAAFRTNPRPATEVIELLERALSCAKAGHVQAVAILAIGPLNGVETLLAGELSAVRSDVLIGGLTRTIHNLVSRP